MRRIVVLALLFLLPVAAVHAAQPKCPLDPEACLEQFALMKERPWLGVEVHTDSLGRRSITRVVPGSPAQRAGVKVGDELLRVDGKAPADWFAGKAGWKSGDTKDVTVLRGGRERALHMPCEAIPEDLFARIVGEHMLEGHLAYMQTDGEGDAH